MEIRLPISPPVDFHKPIPWTDSRGRSFTLVFKRCQLTANSTAFKSDALLSFITTTGDVYTITAQHRTIGNEIHC